MYFTQTGAVSTLSTTTCSVIDDYDHSYCEWSYYAEDEEHDWDCGSGIFCEAFADGYCGYLDFDLSYTDCDGNEETETVKQYFQCCDGGNDCNHDITNVDMDTCVKATGYENMYSNYYDCLTEPGSAYYTYLCPDSVDEITCTGLTKVFRQSAECQCGFYGDLYSEVSTKTQQALQEEIDESMEEYSQWNDVLGCNIKLSCSLATGGTVSGSSGVDGKSYFIAFVWSFIVYFANQ